MNEVKCSGRGLETAATGPGNVAWQELAKVLGLIGEMSEDKTVRRRHRRHHDNYI